ncbi:hypothetical protein ACGC1H_003471 [Rhizoctonia solani]|uniref:Uncharacterized protein n=1 Tax=Rhizoctonia solani TaxID=456999 RepID=A0A8H3GHY7_9AGAM|nr:unnamed protein product [Rhizoctonia solani]
MISVTQSSYYANLFDTVWQQVDVPEAKSKGKSLADTLIIPFEEKTARHLTDDQTEADKVLLYMLTNGIPQTIVHSIVRSDSYDIIVPSNISTAPYIAISYADDTEEEHSAFINDTCPIQDPGFLTIPSPDEISADGEEEISDETCSDTVAEDLDASLCAVVDFDELGDWESTTDLERYFSGCDDRFEAIAPPETSLVGLTSVGSSPNIASKTSRDILKVENEDPEISEEVDFSWDSYESDTESELTRSSDE